MFVRGHLPLGLGVGHHNDGLGCGCIFWLAVPQIGQEGGRGPVPRTEEYRKRAAVIDYLLSHTSAESM